jgi:hypothetical protein
VLPLPAAPASGRVSARTFRKPARNGVPFRWSASYTVRNSDICAPGGWSGDGVVYSYRRLRDSTPLAGAADASYTVATADLGHRLGCRVTARRWRPAPTW